MNAAIQLLRSIPEMNKAIRSFKITNNENVQQGLVRALGVVFSNLEHKDFSP